MNLARRVANVLMLTNEDDELRDAALDEFYPRTKSRFAMIFFQAAKHRLALCNGDIVWPIVTNKNKIFL